MRDKVEDKSTVNDFPVIKTLVVDNSCYVYDACTNQLLKVDSSIFFEICKLQKEGIGKYREQGREDRTYSNMNSLLSKGLFGPSFIKKIEHPDTKYIAALTDRCLNQLVLGITNQCNFNCRYCHQSEGKKLSVKLMMDKEIALRSVDYLFEHSKDAFGVTVTFYGGEPLINFELIKSTVEYATEKFKVKKVSFNITTNASLLDREKADYLATNNFDLLISLDGDKKTQDLHRRYNKDGKGTFASVWKNITFLKEHHPDYFYSKVRFNSVILQDEDPEDVLRFFSNNNIRETAVSLHRADMSGIDYYASPIKLYKMADAYDVINESKYREYLECFLDKGRIPEVWHHNGPCVPTVRRLFISADGDFYPCEKIDSDCSCKIGSLDEGINTEKVSELMNVGKMTESECRNCWALRFCTMCVHDCIGEGVCSRSVKLNNCKLQKKNALAFFKEYIRRKETSE